MATQQLLFDILATSKGVDKTFQEVADSADSMAGKLGAAGAKATSKLFSPMTAAAAGGIAGAALMSGLSTAIENDSMNKKLAAQLDLSAEDAGTAGKVAGNLYAGAYGDSMESVNEAVGAVSSSIAKLGTNGGADVEKLSMYALNLASAFDVDVNEAASTAGVLLKTGLAVDGTQAMDLITSAMQRVPAAMRGEVFPTLSEYSKHFANLGIDGETAVGLIANASQDGAISIDKIGDALKEVTIRATDGSKSTGLALQSIGLDAGNIATSIAQGGPAAKEAFGQIVAGLQTIQDPALQAQTSVALFGTPLEDLGADQIPNFLGQIDPMGDAFAKVGGASDNLNEKLAGGAANGWTSFQRSMEGALATIGEQVLPILTPVLEGLTQFAPVIGPAVIALGALAAVIAVVNFVMAMSPVTWIIVGIVALIAAIVALVMNWDTVVGFLTQVWAGFVGWFTGVMDGFFGWWNGVWAGFASWIVGVWTGFTGMLGDIWNGFVNWIIGLVTGFGSFIGGAFSGIVNFAVAVWSGLGAFFGGLWSGIVNGVSGMIGKVGGFFSGMWGTVVGALSGAGQWLYNAGRDIVDGLFNGIKSLAGTIGNFFLGLLPGWIVEPFKIALGIQSPSKVFAGFGENIGEGILVGVGRTQSRIDDRMASLVTVPDIGSGGLFGVTGAGNSTGRSSGGGSTIDDLIQAIRTQRPVNVHAAPGMDEELVGRATAEQILWRG